MNSKPKTSRSKAGWMVHPDSNIPFHQMGHSISSLSLPVHNRDKSF